MNTLKKEPEMYTPPPPVVTEMMTSDILTHSQDGHLPNSRPSATEQSSQSFLDDQGSSTVNLSTLETPEASKAPEFGLDHSSAAKMVVTTPEVHTAAQTRGASGHPGGPPAPVPPPLPGYSGTAGCLDAHYPRCLMGHYF